MACESYLLLGFLKITIVRNWITSRTGCPHLSGQNFLLHQYNPAGVYLPSFFMTVRHEIAEPRRETGAWSPVPLGQGQAHKKERRLPPIVRGGSGGRARRLQARRSSGSAIGAEVFMNNAG
jgi:hypothetical protein